MNLIDIFDGVTGGVSLYSPLFGEVQFATVKLINETKL